MKSVQSDGMNRLKRGEWLMYAIAIVVACCSGYYASGTEAARIYAGDILVTCLLALIITVDRMSDLRVFRRWMLFWLLLPIVGGFCDLANHLAYVVLLKGAIRNLIFASSIVCGIMISRALRPVHVVWFLVAWLCSPFVWEMIKGGSLSDIPFAMKYYSLSNWAVVYLIIPFAPMLAAAALASGAIIAFVFDARGAGAVHGIVGLLVAISYLRTKVGAVKTFIAVCILCVPVFGYVGSLAVSSAYKYGTYDRGEASNQQRVDMMLDSYNIFTQHPLAGVGSYGVADRFVDALNQTSLVTVHSVLMQYAAEYGVWGFGYVASAMVISAFVMFRVMRSPGRDARITGTAFCCCNFWLSAALLVPYSGVFKASAPLSFGIALGLLPYFTPLARVPKRPWRGMQLERRHTGVRGASPFPRST